MLKRIILCLLILLMSALYSQQESVQAGYGAEFGRNANFLQASQLIDFRGESQIDGALPSAIGVTGTFQNRPFGEGDSSATICETTYTFETSVDGIAFPVEVESVNIAQLEREDRFDITCGWAVHFAPFFFAPGEHTIDSEGCDFIMENPCQSFSGTFQAIYSRQNEAPILRAIQPSSGAPGDSVTLSLANSSANVNRVTVTFGEQNASLTSTSENLAVVRVPDGLSAESVVDVQAFVDGVPSNQLQFALDEQLAPRLIDFEDINNGFMVREVLFFLNGETSLVDIENLRASLGFASFQEFEILGLVRGILPDSVTPEQTIEVVNLLNADSRISFAFLNLLVQSSQLSRAQTSQDAIRQDWLENLGGQHISAYFPNLAEGIRIAVIDSGIDLDSDQVRREFIFDPTTPLGINFAGDRDQLETAVDGIGHGTAVTSIAAALDRNGVNGSGVASSAQIIPLRVFQPELDENGDVVLGTDGHPLAVGNILRVARSLSDAYLMGADVINMSLENHRNADVDGVNLRDYYESILNEIEAFIDAAPVDISPPVLVASTGNTPSGALANTVNCPACMSRFIAVGSVFQHEDGSWVRSGFSNYGFGLDFVAEGENITTTLLDGAFGVFDVGTSFSAPQVAGLAALILGENPNLDPNEVFSRIQDCFVEDIGVVGVDPEMGWGRIVIRDPANAAERCL